MADELVLQVYGTPASAGSKTPVPTKKGVRVVDGGSKDARAARATWRQDVVKVARDAIEFLAWERLEGAVRLTIHLYVPRPAGLPQRRRDGTVPLPTKRPDMTKLLRSTEDALTAAGVWADDAQVVYLHAEKHYATAERPPGAHIHVRSAQ